MIARPGTRSRTSSRVGRPTSRRQSGSPPRSPIWTSWEWSESPSTSPRWRGSRSSGSRRSKASPSTDHETIGRASFHSPTATFIRMIMDIYEPDEGSVRLFDQVGGGRTHSARIGYLPEERGLYPRMRVLDVLVFLAEAKGVSRREARSKALEWLERLGLVDWRLRKVSDLSKGMQQKVQFIATILHDPELVILDEPFSGLDPVNSQVLRDTVVDYRRRGKTVLFSTHIMEHAEKLCDRLCIIARGEKLIDGTLAEVKRTHGGQHLIVAFDGSQGGAQRIFSDRRLVAKIQDFGQQAELELANGADPQET